MRQLAAILIGFVHDFATGCWAASVFAVWWLERQSLLSHLLDVALGLQKQFFFMGLAAIAMVWIVFALSFPYGATGQGKQAERKRRRALIGKQIFLSGIFGLGTWWQYRMIFG